jgi:hypothetical protein
VPVGAVDSKTQKVIARLIMLNQKVMTRFSSSTNKSAMSTTQIKPSKVISGAADM